MNKAIAVILVLMLLVCGCKIQETVEIRQETIRQEQNTGQVKLGVVKVQSVSEDMRMLITGKLKADADFFGMYEPRVSVSSGSTRKIVAGLRNDHESEVSYAVSADCADLNGNAVSIIAPVHVSAMAGAVEVFNMDINAQGIGQGIYICKLNAESSLGEKSQKEAIVEVA